MVCVCVCVCTLQALWGRKRRGFRVSCPQKEHECRCCSPQWVPVIVSAVAVMAPGGDRTCPCWPCGLSSASPVSAERPGLMALWALPQAPSPARPLTVNVPSGLQPFRVSPGVPPAPRLQVCRVCSLADETRTQLLPLPPGLRSLRSASPVTLLFASEFSVRAAAASASPPLLLFQGHPVQTEAFPPTLLPSPQRVPTARPYPAVGSWLLLVFN